MFAGERAEVEELTSSYMDSLNEHCSTEGVETVDSEALKDLVVAADAAAAHTSVDRPLAGAKVCKSSGETSAPKAGPRQLAVLKKLMGAEGLKNLLKTGDVMDFSGAAIRVAEINAVQKRWSVSVLSGDVRMRTLEQKCPFFAAKSADADESSVDQPQQSSAPQSSAPQSSAEGQEKDLGTALQKKPLKHAIAGNATLNPASYVHFLLTYY